VHVLALGCPSAMHSPRGDDLSRIEVQPSELNLFEKVGTGCTAEVFRGEFRGKTVAIKHIEWSKLASKEAHQKAFDREAAIMAKVQHENLVQLLGICSIEKPLRVITEFCAGGCCFELLHNHADDIELQLSQQLKMSIDVAKAMQYLHQFEPQIIHRDLKSLNLLLKSPVLNSNTNPIVKVSDFGLARMKESSGADWGKMTIAAGTCHWMAPEVHHGSNYDNKVDVYSYSMILFEILCREIPFEEEEPASVGGLILKGQRPDLEAVPPDTPRELEALMVKCWDAVPSDRPDFPTILREIYRVVQNAPGCADSMSRLQ